VSVGNDATHGTLATVTVTAPGAASQEAIARRCTELLGGFQIRHVVTFG
jgi:fatty-acyl-CoA synthase